MKTTVDDLKTRRSCRAYLPKQVDQDVLKEILEAGTYAPTGKGLMSPKMVVVQDPETIRAISRMNAAIMGSENDPFYGAPTLVIVFADASVPTYVEDGSLVMGNLMNAAHALGVASCWIHRAKEVFETEEGKEILKKAGLEGEYLGIGNLVIGYADQQPKAAPRKAGRAFFIK